MFDEGIYRNSKDETRKQWFENVSYEYGLSAVDDVRREQPAGSVESKYFKYGIIKADSLEGIDLNDEKSYAERNFSDKISLEDVPLLPPHQTAVRPSHPRSRDCGSRDSYGCILPPTAQSAALLRSAYHPL